MTKALSPIVANKAGQIVANSRDVADFFDKRHDHVLADIRRLGEAGVPDFRETPYKHPQNGQLYRSFDMTRDGFALLAMGFTGSAALQFKLRYIEAFNAMEAQLKAAAPVLPNFTDPAEAAIAWANEYKAKQIAQQRVVEVEAVVAEMKPLASIGARAVSHEHSLARFVRTLPGRNITFHMARELIEQGYDVAALAKVHRA